MEEKKLNEEIPNKPAYEELNDYCNQLMMQNRELASRLKIVMDIQNAMPFLFEVAKNPEIFGEETANKSIDKIKDILPLKDKEANNSDSKED